MADGDLTPVGELVHLDDVGGALALEGEILRKARKIVEDGTPENTKRAFASDLAYWRAWCAAKGFAPSLPYSSETVITFIVEHVEGLEDEVDRALVASRTKRDFGPHAISTIRRRIAMLSTAHDAAGLPNPCADRQVAKLLARAGRAVAHNGWTPKKKAAAQLEVLEALLATCGTSEPHDIRDRALLLFGFSSGGRRRSEIAAASYDRLERHGSDFVYNMGLTKTSQDEDAGAVPIAGRAAEAMEAWLDLRGDEPGPLFMPILPNGVIERHAMHPESVSLVVNRRAERAGLDARKYTGHSLRAGFLTEAGLQGVDLLEAMQLSQHKSMNVAGGYYRAGNGLRNRGAKLAG